MKPQGRPKIGNISKTGLKPLLEDCIRPFVENWKEDFTISDTETGWIAIAAIWPDKVGARGCGGLTREFNKLYAQRPDFVLALTVEIRAFMRNPSNAFRVEKFIMEGHGWLPDGTHINSTDKESDKEATIAKALKVSEATVKSVRQKLARRS